MATVGAMAPHEQRARERLLSAATALAPRVGMEPPRKRPGKEPIVTAKSLQDVECLAVLAEALVALAGDLDEIKAARASTKGAR